MRRLGLDIGTNSIGWCLIEYDKTHPIGQRIVDIGVRIFSDGRDPKSGASLAVDRREARAMRRRRDRYLGRRSAFHETPIQYGLMPEDQDEARLVAEKDPYELRKKALDEALTPHEIGRALFHLNQRRGFKSNRKADRTSKDGEDGKIATGAKTLDAAMAEAGARTLGEFLAGRAEKRVRLNGENQAYDFYPQRHHIEYEFNTIWDTQAQHHPTLLTHAARVELYSYLFLQRPLKTPEVGFCTFAGMNGVPADEHRLPKAHPLFQQRRLYEEVNNLRIVAPGEA
uniref:type II CRISPR RNA-guided endonuclease Cas9 n=1 Tax=Asticcacaulis sp. TaxID=1872648 RepID=UPI00261C2EA9